MTTALWIWSGYHVLALFGALFTIDRRSAEIPLVLISWMAWAAMLWSGHDSWFLWTNAPVIAVILIAGLGQLSKPPAPDTEERATNMVWSATLRLFAVLVCWALA